MTTITPDPNKIRAFRSEVAFETWLAAHHDRDDEIYLRIYKKGAKTPSVTYAQALDGALCWGWIDGLKKSFDDASFLQRFTPRKPKSLWSAANRKRVARLIQAKRMTPHGLRQVEAAQKDGRWDSAYEGAKNSEAPADLLAAIRAEPKALATFGKLSKVNLYALTFRINTLKTPAGRARRIGQYVAMLARGETIHPQRER